MLKFTRQHQNQYQNKKKEELQELINKKIKVSSCLSNYEKKIAEHDINNSLKNKDYITYQSIITACKKEIPLLEKQIEGIQASLAAYGNASKTSVTQKSSEKKENQPRISQQQLCEQIAKLKNRNTIQEVNASKQAQNSLTHQQEREIDNKLKADSQPFLPGASGENSDDNSMHLRYLSVILEEDEADMVMRLSGIGKEQLLSLRKSIVSIKSELLLDEETELREFERLEHMVAQAENATPQQNSDQELIAGLAPISQRFFKSIVSNDKANSNCVYESHKLS